MFEWYFGVMIFKLISVTDGWGISCETAVSWMSLGLTDDKSTVVQVMVWCCQATSHYLSQCRPRSVSPYSVTRPHWVNIIAWFTIWEAILQFHNWQYIYTRHLGANRIFHEANTWFRELLNEVDNYGWGIPSQGSYMRRFESFCIISMDIKSSGR